MFSNINNRIGDSGNTDRYIGKFHVTLENVCASLCFLAAAIFFLVAVFGTWKYFFIMGMCLSVGIMIYGEAPEDIEKKKRHGGR